PIAALKIVGFDVTPYTTPARIIDSSSPDWMSPSLIVSSQTLWPSSWSATQGFFIGGPSLRDSTSPLRGGEHHPASLGIDRGDDTVPPGHVRRRALELDPLRGKSAVGAVHVLHHEIERRLLRGTGLAHALHRRHEPHAGRVTGLHEEVVHRRVLLESPKSQEIGVEALHVVEPVRRVVHVLTQEADRDRRRCRSLGRRLRGRSLRGRLLSRGRPLLRCRFLRGFLACGHDFLLL